MKPINDSLTKKLYVQGIGDINRLKGCFLLKNKKFIMAIDDIANKECCLYIYNCYDESK